MPLLLRRAISSAGLRRSLSTAPSRPPWAIIESTILVKSTSPRASLQLAEPPRFSDLLVPAHHINPLPRIDSDPKSLGLLGGAVRSTSGDGLLLLQFEDGPATAPVVAKLRAAREGEGVRLDIDPDITRFVCNPLSGQMSRLPVIDGTKKVHTWYPQGILTQSVRGHGPPDRYAVAELSVDGQYGEGEERSFVMRRFFSRTGEWDKLVGLPSPLTRPRRIHLDHEVLAFAGRLWWVDLTWGAVSADPFSDQPELRFVELPRGSVTPVPGTNKIAAQGMFRRMGVSEGRLRYAEVSENEPSVLSSYALDDDGDGWTLEHRVALGPILADAGTQEGTPRIGVIDPLNAHAMYVIYGNLALAIDMDKGKVLASVLMEGVRGGPAAFFSAFLKACVLPPWLGTTQIPSAGD
ncbi:hypothetical protein HU200_031886 [Digitaria exilis]|uniref:DUF1618 domain-containing protein n=1 Tax=Digitaria exilis TaxID=1010633 RepID=A0A835BNY5_9POAL|nr:hypothetical protein HU200_031886 [Digitaria exilis]CAB3464977.1 unnamed protein product [Digitaria exilis]